MKGEDILFLLLHEWHCDENSVMGVAEGVRSERALTVPSCAWIDLAREYLDLNGFTS